MKLRVMQWLRTDEYAPGKFSLQACNSTCPGKLMAAELFTAYGIEWVGTPNYWYWLQTSDDSDIIKEKRREFFHRAELFLHGNPPVHKPFAAQASYTNVASIT